MISSFPKHIHFHFKVISLICFMSACSAIKQPEICSGEILYVAPGMNSRADIYSINPNSSEITMWTENPGFDGYPSWAPNGQEIALISSYQDENKLLIVDHAGNQHTKSTQDDIPWSDVSWAKEGDRLSFISFTSTDSISGSINLGIIDLDNGLDQYKKIPIQEKYGIIPISMRWTSDSSLIAFLGGNPSLQELEDGLNIYLIDVVSQEIENITDTIDGIGYFDWAFDSQEFIFTQHQGDKVELYRMNLETSRKTKLGTKLKETVDLANIGSITWSPDKQRIAFLLNQRELYAMDIDGSNLTKLLEIEDILGDERQSKNTLDWQPKVCP